MDSAPRTAQPGLEVASHYDTTPVTLDGQASSNWGSPPPPGSSGLHNTQEQKIWTGDGYESLGPQTGYGTYANANGAAHAADEKPARRIPWLLIGLGGLITFVLAGAIGGVAGWKITSNRIEEPEASLPGSGGGGGGGGTPSSATKIVSNSALTAVGWRFGTDITFQVFFQGPDASLRRSEYKSIYQNWTEPMVVNAAPKLGSPFGAGQLWSLPDTNLPVIPQAELFFIGAQNKIGGANFREGFTSGGLSDSINDGGWTTSNNDTQMASYWPSTILQASNGDVMEIWFDYKTPKFTEPKRVGVTASANSALAILPRESTHSAGEQTSASSARIIYRDTTGRLRNFDRSSGGQQLTSSGEIPVTVDANFTMAAFAVARGETSDGQASSAVNTWVLYQDSSTGKISYVYENGTDGWKGPATDPVFDGADNPTHLACVTASSMKIPEVPLQPAHDLSHCFFQAGKQLKQVHFDGSSWTAIGFLPIP